jgi:hypothetical protein
MQKTAVAVAFFLLPFFLAAENEKPPAASPATVEAAKKFLIDDTGDPKSIEWIQTVSLGELQWLGTGGMYRVIVVKYRAKNDVGAMQVFTRAVLFEKDGTVAVAMDYPSGDLRDPSKPNPLNALVHGIANGEYGGRPLKSANGKAAAVPAGGPTTWKQVRRKKNTAQHDWFSTDGHYAIHKSTDGYRVFRRSGGSQTPLTKGPPVYYATIKEAEKIAAVDFQDRQAEKSEKTAAGK